MQMTQEFNWDHVAYWQHYKGGRYEILHIGTMEEDQDAVVVYRELDGTKVWVRRKEVFFEDVTVNGKTVPRFQSITWREALQKQNKGE